MVRDCCKQSKLILVLCSNLSMTEYDGEFEVLEQSEVCNFSQFMKFINLIPH